jgi:NitT/TauT family transport system substrate-binding protein
MKKILTLLALCGASHGLSTVAQAQTVKADGDYTFVVSIYAGWMPWYFLNDSGILDRWEEKEGITINVEYMDYGASVDSFTAGTADAVAITNMDTVIAPVNSGIRSTALIVGDFSNGNDAILLRGFGPNATVKDLKGQDIYMLENSVSHFLLARALAEHGMTMADVNIINAAEAEIRTLFESGNANDKLAAVTWNPVVMAAAQKPGVVNVYDSSKIPGEILDLCVVNADLLEADPRIGRVLVGAWYEAMGMMTQRGTSADRAKGLMAQRAGCDLEEFNAQLRTTMMFWEPQTAIAYSASQENMDRNARVRDFCVQQGLISDNNFGIKYPDGTVQGNAEKILFIYDNSYMKQAAEGKLSRK